MLSDFELISKTWYESRSCSKGKLAETWNHILRQRTSELFTTRKRWAVTVFQVGDRSMGLLGRRSPFFLSSRIKAIPLKGMPFRCKKFYQHRGLWNSAAGKPGDHTPILVPQHGYDIYLHKWVLKILECPISHTLLDQIFTFLLTSDLQMVTENSFDLTCAFHSQALHCSLSLCFHPFYF